MNKHDRLTYLFDRLTEEQQQDLLNLMEMWNNMPRPAEGAGETTLNPALEETLGREWMCLNALKKVVATHFQPRLELGYVAFHPYLDSVSNAKSRQAAKTMYTLEAAYELKRIFEAEPDSELFTGEVADTLHSLLHANEEADR
ncbi:hypothetical protein [Tumebacillus lipolyticus]|uniref:Uncharacterized protein n=1 Tax=Tumebacillus lipolyticus TaxID=1280370 RepID=A0ABW4ZZZ9_9BACL